MPGSPTLAVVIPVFNEGDNLTTLLSDWQEVFQITAAHYRIIFIDDGSADHSPKTLVEMKSRYPDIEIISQGNAGHGPSILRGYRRALDAEWVFQIDSDHQLDTAAFQYLWNNRDGFDLLLAERINKDASAGRRCLSVLSRIMVRMLFGGGIHDVNSPYRLMRAAELSEALEKVPAGSFAPNILITAWFILKKRRIFTTGVRPRGGARRRRSRLNGYFLRGAIRSAIQTLLFRIRW